INEYYYQTKNNYPQLSSKQQLIINSDYNVDTPNSLLHVELSQTTQNFCKMDIKEIRPTTQDIKETIFEEDLSIVIDEFVKFYLEEVINKGRERNIRKQIVLDYFNDYKINSQEIYNWLLN